MEIITYRNALFKSAILPIDAISASDISVSLSLLLSSVGVPCTILWPLSVRVITIAKSKKTTHKSGKYNFSNRHFSMRSMQLQRRFDSICLHFVIKRWNKLSNHLYKVKYWNASYKIKNWLSAFHSYLKLYNCNCFLFS